MVPFMAMFMLMLMQDCPPCSPYTPYLPWFHTLKGRLQEINWAHLCTVHLARPFLFPRSMVWVSPGGWMDICAYIWMYASST